MIDHQDPVAKEWDELMRHEQELEAKFKIDVDMTPVHDWDPIINKQEAAKDWIKRETKDLIWARGYLASNDKMKNYAVRYCEDLLRWMKSGRGKSGRHPEPYNVLIYQLIRKLTTWKQNWKRRKAGLDFYVYHKKGKRTGQHRLETNWQLLLYLLLELHLHSKGLPGIKSFMGKYIKKPARMALQALKTDLKNRYKNFPPIHGWYGNRTFEGFPEPETGFRKIILDDNGGLRMVRL
jgi:hypothetical protein